MWHLNIKYAIQIKLNNKRSNFPTATLEFQVLSEHWGFSKKELYVYEKIDWKFFFYHFVKCFIGKNENKNA